MGFTRVTCLSKLQNWDKDYSLNLASHSAASSIFIVLFFIGTGLLVFLNF